MEIKLITLDFWNTIFDSSDGSKRNDFRMLSFIKEIDELGITVKNWEFNEAIQAGWQAFNKIWIEELRTPSPLELVEFILKYLKIPNHESKSIKIAKYFAEAVLAYPPKLTLHFKPTLELLSKKYKLAIISDTGFSPGNVLRQLLEKENVLKYFSAFSFSDETGVSKPHAKAYNLILNELNCLPENALHIGDIERTDIVGAKNIGMKAILYKGDISSRYAVNNPKNTIADSIAHSWLDVNSIIDNL